MDHDLPRRGAAWERPLSRRSLVRRTMATASFALLAGGLSHVEALRAGDDAVSTSASTVAQRADNLLSAFVARRTFRGAALVARRGQVLMSKGYDWADVARRVPNTAQTRFRIASITKQFTAMAILQLQEQGKLRVHASVGAYLPACPRAWRPITLHHLLTHTSGIPDYTTFPTYPAIMGRHFSPAQLLALFRDKPLQFRPGTRWRYSNSGYAVLAYIVARVSGLSYAAFLQRHIFAPLHLTNTGYDVNHPALPGHATGYTTWVQPAAYIDMSVPYGNGCLFSTVDDLYRWDQALTTGHPALVAPTTLRQMFTPYVPTDPAAGPQGVAYGYGWFIGAIGRHREIEHTGAINGFLSANQIYPDDYLTIVVLSNLESDQGLRQLTSDLAGIALGYPDCAGIAQPCAELQ